jgi:streptogramin lyase
LAVDDKRGVIWIADAYNGKIRMLGMNNNQLSTLALMQTLRQPSALALDGESLWIADGAGDRVYRYFFESEFLSRLNIQMA